MLCSFAKGGNLMSDKGTPEQHKERLRQQEIRNNPTGNLNDSLNRVNNGNLVDLVGSLVSN